MLKTKIFIILISLIFLAFLGCLGSDDSDSAASEADATASADASDATDSESTDDAASSDSEESDEVASTAYTSPGVAGAQMAYATFSFASTSGAIPGAIPAAIPGFYFKQLKYTRSGMPDAFFTTDIAAAADGTDTANGYIELSGVYTNQTVKFRFKTIGDDNIDKTFLASKQLAVMGNQAIGIFDWNDLFDDSKTSAERRPSSAQSQVFASAQEFNSLSTIGEYIAWCYTVPDHVETEASVPAGTLTTPDPTSDDDIASFEGSVTFSGTSLDGTISLTINANTEGKPTAGTGTGTLTYDSKSMSATMTLTFDSDGQPSTITLSATTEEDYQISITTDSDGAGTGTVKDSDENTLADIVVNDDGTATVTDVDGNVETLSVD